MQFKVQEKLNDEDLIIIMRGKSESFPDVFISLSKKNPDFEDSDFFCLSYQTSICSIPEQNISTSTTFYVTLRCLKQCAYDFHIEYVKESFLQLGNYTEFYSENSTQQSQVIKLYVPPDDSSFDYVQIQVSCYGIWNSLETLNVYGNPGNNLPSTESSDFFFTDTFIGQKDLILSRTLGLKFDSNYTFLIEYPAKQRAIFYSFAYKEIREITLYDDITDMVNVGAVKKYVLKINSTDLSIDLNSTILKFVLYPVSGQVNIYIDYEDLKDDYKKARFYGNESMYEQITIEPFEVPNNTDTYYIYIVPDRELASSYEFYIEYFNYNESLWIEFDEPSLGEIQQNQIVQYQFWMENNEDYFPNVTVDLIIDQGNVDLFVKRCVSAMLYEGCYINQTEIDDFYKSNKLSALMSSQHQGNEDIIRFQHNSTECGSKSNYSCFYVIAIYGKDLAKFQSSKYKLVLKQDLQLITIKETIPERHRLQANGFAYYQFFLPKFEVNVTNIHISATTLSGNVILFADRTNKFSNFSQSEKKGWLGYINYDSEFDLNETFPTMQNQSYYISVMAFQESFYILNVIVTRNNSKQSIQLSEDTPYSKELKNISSRFYFEFKINWQESWNISKPAVNIWIFSISGNYKIYLSAVQDDDLENNYMWESDLHRIRILSNDQQYPSTGRFYGVLVPQKVDAQNSSSNTTFENYRFEITYATSNTVQLLLLGQTIQNTINKAEYQTYRFEVQKNNSYSISKKSFDINSTGIEIYFAIDKNFTFPTKISNNASISKVDSFEITQQMVNNNCKSFNDSTTPDTQIPHCYFYLTVNATKNTQYSLLFYQKNKQLKLENGIIQHLNYPEKDKPLQCFFLIDNNQKLAQIQQFSKFLPLDIYATIIKNDLNSTTNLSLYPNQQNYSQWTYHETYASFTDMKIQKAELDTKQLNCSDSKANPDGCAVLLSLYTNYSSDTLNINITDKQFGLTLYEQGQTLVSGTPIQGTVEQFSFDQYVFYLPDAETSFRVTVVPLDNLCDPDLYLNKGYNNFTDEKNNQWRSSYLGSDILSLDKSSPEIESGYYTVGVKGSTEGKYQITFIAGNFSFYNIYGGSIIDLQMKQNELVYVQLTNFYNNSIKILTTKRDGQVELAAMSNNQSYSGFVDIPAIDSGKYTWTSKNTNHPDFLRIDNTDANFCVSCDYLIAIKCIHDTSLQLLIDINNQTIQMPSNRMIQDYLKKGEKTEFIYYNNIQNTDAVEIQLNVFSGNLTLYLQQSYDFPANASYDQTLILGVNSTLKNVIKTQFNLKKFEGVDNGLIYQPPLLLMIEGLQDNTNYSIIAHSYKRSVELSYGMPYYDELSLSTSHQYKINAILPSNLQQDKISFSLILRGYFLKSMRSEDAFKCLPLIQVQTDQGSVLCESIEQFRNQIICDLQINQTQNIMFNVTNNGSYAIQQNMTLKYSVIISNKQLNYMLPNDMVSRTQYKGQNDYFELVSSMKSKLLIEAFECYGYLNFYWGQNLTEIKSGSNNKKLNQITQLSGNNHFIAIENLDEAEVIYLRATVKDGIKQNPKDNSMTAKYHMRAKFYNDDEYIPYNKFFIGKKGDIFAVQNKEGDLEVAFFTVYCEDCSDYPVVPIQVQYKLFITDSNEDTIKYFSQCNGDGFNSELFQSSHNMFYQTSLYQDTSAITKDSPQLMKFSIPKNQFTKQTQLLISVVAKITIREYQYDDDIYTFIYNSYNYNYYLFPGSGIPEKIPSYVWVTVYCAIALFVFGSIFLLYVWRRMKKAESQLQFEMTDVRNVAVIDRKEDYSNKSYELDLNPGKSPQKEYLGFDDEK